MKVPPARIVFNQEDRKKILAMVDESLTTGQLTLGRHGKEFERRFAALHGTTRAVAVNSGTSAIEIPLRVLGASGGEVIVPTNTFMATVFGVEHAGARTCFVDHNPRTLAPSPQAIADAITPETRGVVIVHIGGVVSPEMPEIAKLCKDRGIFLFEDAAHAHAASVDGRSAGSFGDAASFSFYPTKVMTSGEGGMIVTNSERLADEAMLYRDQGKASFTANIHDRLGYNWRMSEIHAAIGLQHLERLPGFADERRELAALYDQLVDDVPGLTRFEVPSECSSNYYKYIALLDDGIDRVALKQTLRSEHDVGLSGEVYEKACHLQPFFENRFPEGSFPQAEAFCDRHVCLSMFNGMSKDDVHLVVDSVRSVLAAARTR